MKLYSFAGAPNPRRVLIFAAEKSLQLDVVNVDLRGGETKRPEFLSKNPSGIVHHAELFCGLLILAFLQIPYT